MSHVSLRRLSGKLPKGRSRLFVFLAAFAVLAVYAALPASAIHLAPDTSLELDGNVKDSPAGPPDDWNNFFPSAPADVSFTTGIVPDPEPQTIFTGAQAGGSSKDNQDIPGWRWKCGSVPPKDEISNAASALYDISPTEQRLYFMADREAVNGDSHLGVWFMKKSLTTVPNPPTCPNGAHPFSAAHSVGDILVLSDFTQGGSISNIKVFRWVGVGGTEPKSNGTLNRIGLGTDCIGLPAHSSGDEELCATVNSTLLGPGGGNGPAWPYTPASGAAGSYPPGSFFEGGIDLGSLGLTGQCFGSVLTETRSSSEIDAVLKDFVLHAFEPCTSGITTQASSSVNVGGSISDTATVTGSGGGAPTGTVTFTVCGPFQTPTACTTSDSTAQPAGTRTLNGTDNPAIVTSDLVPVNAAGYFCFLGHYSGSPGGVPYGPSDDNNTTTECVQVTTVPTTTTTRQFVYPQDKAKIVASAGGAVSGTVTFRLFGAAGGNTALVNCQADVTSGGTSTTGLVHTEAVVVSGGFATTNNTSDAVTSGGTYFWHALFGSTNPAQDDSESACVENTVYTFNGDDSTISVP